METDQIDVYWNFVLERHRTYVRRTENRPLIDDLTQPVWTHDDVLRRNKFTNVFRVLDYGSQFLLGSLLTPDVEPEDLVMRAFLYRYQNRPEPWVAYYLEYGEYPTREDLLSGRLAAFWTRYSAEGNPIFGNAYKMFSGAENKGMTRLEWVMSLTRWLSDETDLPAHIIKAQSLTERIQLLQQIPRCAGFMSMQIATDLGYTDALATDENETVVAGPGALRGLKVAFGTSKDSVRLISEVRDWFADRESHGVWIETPNFALRRPSLMDIQNTFCEFGKYDRYVREQTPESTKVFTAKHVTPGEPLLPTHW